MRTENDLREAFDHLAADAPDATEVLARLDRTTPAPAHRRTGLRIAVTVAATAAAVVAAPLLLDRAPTTPPDQPTPPAAAASSTSATRPAGPFPFRIDAPTGWVADGGNLTKQTLSRWISGPGGVKCSLEAYRSGAFRTTTLIGAKPAAPVDGRPAVSAALKTMKPKYTPQVLAWEYSDGAWAVAHCDKLVFHPVPGSPGSQVAKNELTGPLLEQTTRLAAESTDFTVRQGLRTPIKVGRLPGGLQVTEAGVNPKEPGSVITMRGTALTLSLMVTEVHPGPFVTGDEVEHIPVAVKGKRAWLVEGTQLTVRDGEFEYTIGVAAGKLANPKQDLVAIAEQVQVADPDRPDTWFPLELS